jgi:very-short-patch-repair endonuclease
MGLPNNNWIGNRMALANTNLYLDIKMSELNLTREEQETIIRGNAASKTWEVVTADPRIVRKMEKQGYKPDDRKNPWGYCFIYGSFQSNCH